MKFPAVPRNEEIIERNLNRKKKTPCSRPIGIFLNLEQRWHAGKVFDSCRNYPPPIPAGVF